MRSLVLLLSLICLSPLRAADVRMPVPGDCAMLREGGVGYIIKTPTYWLRGSVAEIYTRPHRMELCPRLGKPRERYTRGDWKQIAESYPCVTDPAQIRDVDAIRIRLKVEAWDTPWSSQHGHNGMLFRGHYLDTELKEGVILDIDGTLLERCEAPS